MTKFFDFSFVCSHVVPRDCVNKHSFKIKNSLNFTIIDIHNGRVVASEVHSAYFNRYFVSVIWLRSVWIVVYYTRRWIRLWEERYLQQKDFILGRHPGKRSVLCVLSPVWVHVGISNCNCFVLFKDNNLKPG